MYQLDREKIDAVAHEGQLWDAVDRAGPITLMLGEQRVCITQVEIDAVAAGLAEFEEPGQCAALGLRLRYALLAALSGPR